MATGLVRPLALSIGALAVIAVLCAAIGAVAIPPLDVLGLLIGIVLPVETGASDTTRTILLDIRLPRIVLVAITGAALAGSGAAYQGLFRNPLADPYLLGIASGAGLGAVLAMTAQWPGTVLSFLLVPVSAFVGALATAILVVSVARVGRATPVATLILAGVAIGSFATALSTFLMLRSEGELRRAINWMLGGFALGGWLPVLAVLPEVIVGLTLLVMSARPLNVLQFGEDQARQLGLDVGRARWVVIGAASLTTAAAVAFSGIIGFVGLAVPHLVRLAWGGDYRKLIPLSIVVGAASLLVADLIARTIIAPQELPLGVVTALLGAPFFVWLLRRTKRQLTW
jgi:iron complex transport system permease protein